MPISLSGQMGHAFTAPESRKCKSCHGGPFDRWLRPLDRLRDPWDKEPSPTDGRAVTRRRPCGGAAGVPRAGSVLAFGRAPRARKCLSRFCKDKTCEFFRGSRKLTRADPDTPGDGTRADCGSPLALSQRRSSRLLRFASSTTSMTKQNRAARARFYFVVQVRGVEPP